MKDGTQTGEIIFSDKKMFSVKAKFNPQNDRIVSNSADSIPPSVKTVFCHQKPAESILTLRVGKRKIVYWEYFDSWTSPDDEALQELVFYFFRTVHPRTCEQNLELVWASISCVLEEGMVVSFIARPEPFGLLYVVHFEEGRERYISW